MDNVMVTVLCTTYNHREYIRDCIEGVLAQKTQYSYEMVIYDDASTDGATDILREYKAKYPEIFDIIFMEENQYQKGVDIVREYIASHLRGRFTAFCDGDDYWTDSYKLQKQVDFMLDHPNIVGCGTNATVMDYRDGSTYPYCHRRRNCYLNTNDLMWGEEPLIKPSNTMLRTRDYLENSEEINYMGGYSDRPVLLCMSLISDVYYMAEETIVYRQFTPGSWTANHIVYVDHDNDLRDSVEKINKLSGYKFDEEIRRKYNNLEYRKANASGDWGLLECVGYGRLIRYGCKDIAVSLWIHKNMSGIHENIKKLWRKARKIEE